MPNLYESGLSDLLTNLSEIPTNLRQSVMSKYFKVQGLRELTMAQDARQLLKTDREQQRRYFDEFIPGGSAVAEDDDTTILADNITMARSSGGALPWVLASVLSAIVGAGGMMMWLDDSKPTDPATDNDNVTELEIFRPDE